MTKQIYKYSFSIETETEDEADEIIEALTKLHNSLKKDDLIVLSNFVNDSPEAVEKIRYYLQNPTQIGSLIGMFIGK